MCPLPIHGLLSEDGGQGVRTYLAVAEVTQEELHLCVVKALPHVKYIHRVTPRQQLLYHVLAQEARAPNHGACFSLQGATQRQCAGKRSLLGQRGDR